MRRLSIKYFKGRDYIADEISKLTDGYINDMENFVRNKFPDYKFFYVLWLNQRLIVHLEFLIDNFIFQK